MGASSSRSRHPESPADAAGGMLRLPSKPSHRMALPMSFGVMLDNITLVLPAAERRCVQRRVACRFRWAQTIERTTASVAPSAKVAGRKFNDRFAFVYTAGVPLEESVLVVSALMETSVATTTGASPLQGDANFSLLGSATVPLSHIACGPRHANVTLAFAGQKVARLRFRSTMSQILPEPPPPRAAGEDAGGGRGHVAAADEGATVFPNGHAAGEAERNKQGAAEEGSGFGVEEDTFDDDVGSDAGVSDDEVPSDSPPSRTSPPRGWSVRVENVRFELSKRAVVRMMDDSRAAAGVPYSQPTAPSDQVRVIYLF